MLTNDYQFHRSAMSPGAYTGRIGTAQRAASLRKAFLVVAGNVAAFLALVVLAT